VGCGSFFNSLNHTSCHSRANGNPVVSIAKIWIPAFEGMTKRRWEKETMKKYT
jgi:hypothetical protein